MEDLYSSQFDCEMKFHKLNIAAGVEGELNGAMVSRMGRRFAPSKWKREKTFICLDLISLGQTILI